MLLLPLSSFLSAILQYSLFTDRAHIVSIEFSSHHSTMTHSLSPFSFVILVVAIITIPRLFYCFICHSTHTSLWSISCNFYFLTFFSIKKETRRFPMVSFSLLLLCILSRSRLNCCSSTFCCWFLLSFTTYMDEKKRSEHKIEILIVSRIQQYRHKNRWV